MLYSLIYPDSVEWQAFNLAARHVANAILNHKRPGVNFVDEDFQSANFEPGNNGVEYVVILLPRAVFAVALLSGQEPEIELALV